ncbi:MAG: hypothetical protein OEW60_00270 [Thiovulaceae bacterium]|nr:hypothetical protein [Sulfurimonadaceae bacterium]
MEKINALLEKYDHFVGAQLRSIKPLSNGSKVLTIVLQDDEGEDLNSVKIEFSNINDSRILENSVLPFMDMMSGITLIKENNLYGFAVGRGDAMLYVHNAPLYIVASDITFEDN